MYSRLPEGSRTGWQVLLLVASTQSLFLIPRCMTPRKANRHPCKWMPRDNLTPTNLTMSTQDQSTRSFPLKKSETICSMPAKRSTKQRLSRKPAASACFPGILGWWRWSGSQQEPLGTLCGSTPAPPWQVFGGAAFLRAGEGWGPGKCCRTTTGGGEDYWKEQRWGGIVAWMFFESRSIMKFLFCGMFWGVSCAKPEAIYGIP